MAKIIGIYLGTTNSCVAVLEGAAELAQRQFDAFAHRFRGCIGCCEGLLERLDDRDQALGK